MMRMQFDGSSRAEAIKECSRAVEKLMEYMPVTTQDDVPPSSNQPPTEVSAPVIQVAHFTSQYIKFYIVTSTDQIFVPLKSTANRNPKIGKLRMCFLRERVAVFFLFQQQPLFVEDETLISRWPCTVYTSPL